MTDNWATVRASVRAERDGAGVPKHLHNNVLYERQVAVLRHEPSKETSFSNTQGVGPIVSHLGDDDDSSELVSDVGGPQGHRSHGLRPATSQRASQPEYTMRRWLEDLDLEHLTAILVDKHGYTIQDLISDASLDHNALKELGIDRRGIRSRLLLAIDEARAAAGGQQQQQQHLSQSPQQVVQVRQDRPHSAGSSRSGMTSPRSHMGSPRSMEPAAAESYSNPHLGGHPAAHWTGSQSSHQAQHQEHQSPTSNQIVAMDQIDLENGLKKKTKKAAGSTASDETLSLENGGTGSHFGHDEIGKLALGFVWVTAACMGLGSLVTFVFWLNAPDKDDRSVYGFTFVITLMAMFAYICKGLGQGTWVTSAGKAISWARYADWIITTPLLIVDMCKLAHAPASTTQMLVCIDIVMISLGVASAMTHSRVRSLVWFTASTGMYVLMVVLIQSELGTAIESQADDVKNLFQIFKTMTLATWTMYPLVVLLGDQNAFCSCGIISHDAESIALSVLDIIAKVGVEVLLIGMKTASHAGAVAVLVNGTVAVAVGGGGAH